ncbi:MAG: four helix bundle protein [Bacteroidia bacterium]|nr:four helix bundle protein [Bacteroidia bacterium]
MAFKFENLKVWNRALNYSEEIHNLTLTFPKEELYILTSQIKRAADSVVLNISEGCTGQSDKEYNRFIGYSMRSCVEVVACLYLGKKRKLINDSNFECLYKEAEEIIKMLQGFRKALLANSLKL